MNILNALESVMSGTARQGRFRWPAHLVTATIVLAIAAISTDAGLSVLGTLLTGVSLIPLGFTVAGLIDDLRVHLKGEARV